MSDERQQRTERPQNNKGLEQILSETEYSNEYFSVKRHLYIDAEMTEFERFQVDTPKGVIAIGEIDKELLVIWQYRPQFSRWVCEFPGGGVKNSESITAAAKREFREETGYFASSAEVLASYYVSVWEPTKRYVVWMDDIYLPESSPEVNQESEFIGSVDNQPANAVFQMGTQYQWVHTPLLIAHRAGKLSTNPFVNSEDDIKYQTSGNQE